MANSNSIPRGGETVAGPQGFEFTVGAVVQGLKDWVEKNQETIDRWENPLWMFKVAAIDDIAAIDDSEARTRTVRPGPVADAHAARLVSASRQVADAIQHVG